MDSNHLVVFKFSTLGNSCSGKGLKIMNLGDVQTADGVARVLQDEDDDAVDPHLERIKNLAGGDESDEEVKSSTNTFGFLVPFFWGGCHRYAKHVRNFDIYGIFIKCGILKLIVNSVCVCVCMFVCMQLSSCSDCLVCV